MKKTSWLVAGSIALTAIIAASAADAANYRRDGWWNYHDERWCLSSPEVIATDCAFQTFAQCNYSRNGVGGTCSENPRYVEVREPRRRAKRSYR